MGEIERLQGIERRLKREYARTQPGELRAKLRRILLGSSYGPTPAYVKPDYVAMSNTKRLLKAIDKEGSDV